MRKDWTRHELLVALNIYQKLAFGQLHQRNPAIIAVADKLGRTPGSVAMKLANFASLDPELQLRGIKGLAGASNLDRAVWEEFQVNTPQSVDESEETLRALFSANPNEEIEVSKKEGIKKRQTSLSPEAGTDVLVTVNQRRGQTFFRDIVLNNYGEQCAISEIGVRELLVASHILPWSTHPSERLNVRNGICLSRLHDAAFDRGLITFDADFRLRLSSRLTAVFPKQALLEKSFGAFEGQELRVPANAFVPDQTFLDQHRRTIFKA